MSPLVHPPAIASSAVRLGTAPAQAAGGGLSRVVVLPGATVPAVEELLLAVARGDREASIALESRMDGLVRVNIRRVLRDASRSDSVTHDFFADVVRNAVGFDPARNDAQTWLLTRAHDRAVEALGSAGAAAGEATGLPDRF